MATKETASKYRRASEFAPGIGSNLDGLINKDVLLVDFSIGERNINRRRDDEDESADESENGYSRGRGSEKATIVYLTIAEDPNSYDPENREGTTKMYHAWSDSLAEKLGEIPDKSILPLLIKFMRAGTAGGYRVWTFE